MPQTASNDSVRGELGRFPLYFSIIRNMLKYWVRIIKLPDCTLLKESYMCNLKIKNTDTWSKTIEFLLKELNLSSFWDHNPKDNRVTNIAKKKIILDIYKKFWVTNMHNDNRKIIGQKNKLRTYRKFKIEFEREKYLECLLNDEYRNILLKFRVSCHGLFIETGRHLHLLYICEYVNFVTKIKLRMNNIF